MRERSTPASPTTRCLPAVLQHASHQARVGRRDRLGTQALVLLGEVEGLVDRDAVDRQAGTKRLVMLGLVQALLERLDQEIGMVDGLAEGERSEEHTSELQSLRH